MTWGDKGREGGSKIQKFGLTSFMDGPLVILPLKSVISGLSLLSKNLENTISQNGKSEKKFYTPFLIHIVVEF